MGDVSLGVHAPHKPPNVELSAVLLPPALRDKLVNHGFRMTADFTGLGPTELSKGKEEKRAALRVTCRASSTPRRAPRPACWHAFLRAHNTVHTLLCTKAIAGHRRRCAGFARAGVGERIRGIEA